MDQKLLMRYISGNATEKEKADIAKWLNADPVNMREFLKLRELHDIMIWQKVPPSGSGRILAGRKPGAAMRKILIETLKVAAAVLVTLLVARHIFPAFMDQKGAGMHTVTVPSGQHAELTLSDGTEVWLNTNTTFTFPEYFSEKSREVQLDGEGYFKVTKNEKQPFIVHSLYDVKVLGTEFNLISYSTNQGFEASLLTGSIELRKEGSTDTLVLRPNERAYVRDSQLVREAIADYSQFQWKQGIISFRNESFQEIIRKLELYYDMDIIIKNKDALNYRCTGKFRTKEGIEHILKVLQLDNPFRYRTDEQFNTIIIE